MTYKEALELNESKAGLDLKGDFVDGQPGENNCVFVDEVTA